MDAVLQLTDCASDLMVRHQGVELRLHGQHRDHLGVPIDRTSSRQMIKSTSQLRIASGTRLIVVPSRQQDCASLPLLAARNSASKEVVSNVIPPLDNATQANGTSFSSLYEVHQIQTRVLSCNSSWALLAREERLQARLLATGLSVCSGCDRCFGLGFKRFSGCHCGHR